MKTTLPLYIFFSFLWVAFGGFAQESEQYPSQEKDSLVEKQHIFNRLVQYFEEAKKDKTQEKFDISFIGGPSYSVDTKLGIGLLASGLYRIDKSDIFLPPSDVSIYSNITTSGFFSIGIINHSIFPDDQYRVNVSLNYAYLPTKYYGIGYEAGRRGIYSKYDRNQISFSGDVQKKIWNHFYGGLNVTIKDIHSKKFKNPEIAPLNNLNNFIFGGGIILSYDSRDFVPNPSRGFYFKYEENFYPRFLGNDNHYREAFIAAKTYQKIWKGAILASEINSTIKTGDVPWSQLSLVGGSYQMRGYFTGRYRDKKQMNAQVEIRQKIYNRHGAVAWVGAGKIFDHFSNLNARHILPNYGLGYRWEFKKNVNIRFDYGMGKEGGGFYFNVNEAF